MSNQSDAAARRLAQLTAELEAVRAAEGLSARDLPQRGQPTTDPHDPGSRPGIGAVPSGAESSSPAFPVPGRHASRGRVVSRLEALRERVAIGPAQLAVVAVVVAVGITVTAWWLLRANGQEVAPLPVSGPLIGTSTAPSSSNAVPAPSPAAGEQASAAGTSTGAGSTTAGETQVVVDVAGKVRRPGIVVLPAGSRVVDAVKRAGGTKPGVSLTALNQARLLVDGEQILVGIRPVPGLAASAAAAPGASSGSGGGLVNLNTADSAQLEELPQVGPVTAEAIIDWRTEHGGFTAVEELLDVDGIGEVTLAKIAPHVTV